MTGVVFENAVPLSKSDTNSMILKTQQMVDSLSLSQILTTKEQKHKFIDKIVAKNNYEAITPLWGKKVEGVNSISVEEFHENCDNKGPILILVKTDNNCIFGGISPQGFDAVNSYSASDTACLFSFSNNTDREPVICKVKQELSAYAIKNNESKYSPGFGCSNKSDLFISFKNLNKSYS